MPCLLKTGLHSKAKKTSVDAAVDRLNIAINIPLSSGYIEKENYHAWFSGKLKFYVKR
jgi:hypothetical protein